MDTTDLPLQRVAKWKKPAPDAVILLIVAQSKTSAGPKRSMSACKLVSALLSETEQGFNPSFPGVFTPAVQPT